MNKAKIDDTIELFNPQKKQIVKLKKSFLPKIYQSKLTSTDFKLFFYLLGNIDSEYIIRIKKISEIATILMVSERSVSYSLKNLQQNKIIQQQNHKQYTINPKLWSPINSYDLY